MSTKSLPWYWIVETLAQVKELDTSILEAMLCRIPGFSENAPETVQERVALRYLEKLVASPSTTDVPSTSASIDADEPTVEVLKKVAGLCKLEKDKDKLPNPDLQRFILQKRASLPKSSLQLLSSSLESHSQVLLSLKEHGGFCIHNRADCLQCSIGDDGQIVKKPRLSRNDAEIQSLERSSPVLAHDGGTVIVQEDHPGSMQHVNKPNVSDGDRINFSSDGIQPSKQTLSAPDPDHCKVNFQEYSSGPGQGGKLQPLKQTSAALAPDCGNMQEDSSELGQHMRKQNISDVDGRHYLHRGIDSTGDDASQALKHTSVPQPPSDRSTKNVNPASCERDLSDGSTSCDSGGAYDVPTDFDLCDDVFNNEKHCSLSSQGHANHDSVTRDWTEQGLCMKCDNGGQLLSCSASGCSIAVHESCLGSFVKFEKTGLFYCPFCSYRRATIAYCKAWKNVSWAKKALSAFVGKDAVPGHQKEQSYLRVHKETTRPEVAGNVSHQLNLHQADKLNESLSTAKEQDQQIEVDKVCDKGKLPGIQTENPSSVEGCDVSHNAVEKKLPSEDRDSSHIVHAYDVSKAKQNGGVDLSSDHLSTQQLKNHGQAEDAHDDDASCKVQSPQASEKHYKRRRQDAALVEPCHPQQTVGDQNRDKSSQSKGGKFKSQSKRYSNPIIPFGRRKKLSWTKEEEEVLKEAVQKYMVNSDGTLPWTKFLEFGRHVFHKTRQACDLKDKWRNIQIKEGLRTKKT